MPLKVADYALHPPSGSNLPGKEEANSYIFIPPNELREMIMREQDTAEKDKMVSALKQFERVYVFPGYPWRKSAKRVIQNYRKRAELTGPSINLPYYQDSEVPCGQSETLNSLQGIHDNDNMERFDYNRQGIRPVRDIDCGRGDYSSPHDSLIGPVVVKPRGDGPDPEGLEYPTPPTGGDIDAWPDYAS
jgi:hypothetical protein